MSTELASPTAAVPAAHVRLDLERYRQVSHALESTQTEVEKLEHTEAFEVFQKQLGLLRKRLLNSPQSLRQVFIDDGLQAIVWEFTQDALGASFTKMLWSLLLRGDDMSTILQRFIWALPLKFKRKFIAAIDAHLSRPLPDVQGPVERLAGRELHPAVCPSGGRAQERLRAGDDGLPRLSRARLFAARSRHVRVARSAARQAVRGQTLRARRLSRRESARRAAARSSFISPTCST